MNVPTAISDDAKQILRGRLFVGEAGRRGPRIADYRGRGELKRWVRASAVRIALRLLRDRANTASVTGDAVLDALAEPGQDPELELLRQRYGEAFEAALRVAFDELGARDKNLLRYHFGKGLTIDDLGTVYRVHRATAARRLTKASAKLALGTRSALERRLGLSLEEMSSILPLVRRRLEGVLSGILAPLRAT
jgi:RNA polymerase sigma-70 factor (ECF subfamily)